MRTISVWLHGGIIAIASSTLACNSMLGVEDVSVVPPDANLPPRPPPDAAPPDCKVAAHFSMIVSTPSTSLLAQRPDGGPSLLFLLDSDAKPDILAILLFNNVGGHGTLNTVGTYSLDAADIEPATCGLCVAIFTDVDPNASTVLPTYFALAQGSLSVTRADATGMAGHVDNLKLRHIDASGTATTDVNDGCAVAIDDVQFDLMYSQPVTAGADPPPAPGLAVIGNHQQGRRALRP